MFNRGTLKCISVSLNIKYKLARLTCKCMNLRALNVSFNCINIPNHYYLRSLIDYIYECRNEILQIEFCRTLYLSIYGMYYIIIYQTYTIQLGRLTTSFWVTCQNVVNKILYKYRVPKIRSCIKIIFFFGGGGGAEDLLKK